MPSTDGERSKAATSRGESDRTSQPRWAAWARSAAIAAAILLLVAPILEKLGIPVISNLYWIVMWVAGALLTRLLAFQPAPVVSDGSDGRIPSDSSAPSPEIGKPLDSIPVDQSGVPGTQVPAPQSDLSPGGGEPPVDGPSPLDAPLPLDETPPIEAPVPLDETPPESPPPDMPPSPSPSPVDGSTLQVSPPGWQIWLSKPLTMSPWIASLIAVICGLALMAASASYKGKSSPPKQPVSQKITESAGSRAERKAKEEAEEARRRAEKERREEEARRKAERERQEEKARKKAEKERAEQKAQKMAMCKRRLAECRKHAKEADYWKSQVRQAIRDGDRDQCQRFKRKLADYERDYRETKEKLGREDCPGAGDCYYERASLGDCPSPRDSICRQFQKLVSQIKLTYDYQAGLSLEESGQRNEVYRATMRSNSALISGWRKRLIAAGGQSSDDQIVELLHTVDYWMQYYLSYSWNIWASKNRRPQFREGHAELARKQGADLNGFENRMRKICPNIQFPHRE